MADIARLEFSIGRLWRWALANTVLVTGSLLLAGRLDLPWLWAYLCGLAVLTLYAFAAADPDLGRERRRPGGPTTDPIRMISMRLLGATTLIVALLDAGRFGWSSGIPFAVRTAAFAVGMFGVWLAVWAMAANRFFSTAIRIQHDRGHRVVSGGPYAFIRHPGYAGMILSSPAGAIVLGSYWALIPGLAFSALAASRVVAEDAFLLRNLDGYRDYAARVTFRLIPGVW